MNLIAKNKIVDYIRQHPEAQTAFLICLKEHPCYLKYPRCLNVSDFEQRGLI